MKKYFKPVLGGGLILLALGLLVFWEVSGRELVLMENVLVAREDIYPGTEVNPGMFRETGILSESMIDNGMTLAESYFLNNKISDQLILKNSQISRKYFSERKAAIKAGSGIYQIKPEWIFSMSSSIRKNDVADIYSLDGENKIGSFQVAFVKDEQGKEVVDEKTSKGNRKITDRTEGSGVALAVEIISTTEGYKKILDYIFSSEGKLIIVNREG